MAEMLNDCLELLLIALKDPFIFTVSDRIDYNFLMDCKSTLFQ